MANLKVNRKRASSPEYTDRMKILIASNWVETWLIVETRAQAIKAMNLQNLQIISQRYHQKNG